MVRINEIFWEQRMLKELSGRRLCKGEHTGLSDLFQRGGGNGNTAKPDNAQRRDGVCLGPLVDL